MEVISNVKPGYEGLRCDDICGIKLMTTGLDRMLLYAAGDGLPCAEWKQVRFPRSKKKRIRKKWRKDEGNWRLVPRPVVKFKI